MILLPTQIQLFFLSLWMGWLYGLLYSLIQRMFRRWEKTLLRIMIAIVFQLLFHSFAFYWLYQFNGGRLRFYYVLLFLLGIFLFYWWYFPIFFPLYEGIIQILHPPLRFLNLVFSRIIRIIKSARNKFKRRLRFKNVDNCTKKSSKEKEKEELAC